MEYIEKILSTFISHSRAFTMDAHIPFKRRAVANVFLIIESIRFAVANQTTLTPTSYHPILHGIISQPNKEEEKTRMRGKVVFTWRKIYVPGLSAVGLLVIVV